MTAEENKRDKEILLETMRTFIAFCKEHDLTYYACGGTAIGAVRHGGMIPWDDDIDVYMDRANYDRFVALRSQLRGRYEHYEIVEFGEDGYYLPLSKFADKRTTIWETKEYPFIFGVHIDVFPLDCTSGTFEEIAPRADAYRRLVQTYTIGQERYNKDLVKARLRQHGTLKGLLIIAYHILYCQTFRRHVWRKAQRMLQRLLQQQGDQAICYGLEYTREYEIFPLAWFGEPVEMPFEDFTISMPREYDAYLRRQYGDYMQLPPEDQRVSVHGRYFVDLDRRLTIAQVRQLKRQSRS